MHDSKDKTVAFTFQIEFQICHSNPYLGRHLGFKKTNL